MDNQNESPGFGTSDAASMGGKARAESLSADARSEIARRAASARWNDKVSSRKAVAEAPLKINASGDTHIEFECAVLDDETRVISERAFARAIGAKRGGSHWQRRKRDPNGAQLPVFLSANNLKPFINIELASALSSPIMYQTKTGQHAHGIRADLIPQILDVWLKARDAGNVLTERQQGFAKLADIIMRGLAVTGIVALIDEATGYQDLRAKDALAKVLEAFVQKELRPWVHTFPVDYYKEIYRLKGWIWPPEKANRMPRIVGKMTNDIVYARLAPGVHDELHRSTPRDGKGRLKTHLHRRLTADVGHPKLLQHLGAVTTVMKFADDYDGFVKMLDKHYPRQMQAPLFDRLEDGASGD